MNYTQNNQYLTNNLINYFLHVYVYEYYQKGIARSAMIHINCKLIII